MKWEKLEPNHFFKEPVKHFVASTIYDTKEYDRLYENQNNLTHDIWNEFDSKYKVGFQFYEDLQDIDKSKDIMCLWFFKERSDRSNEKDILLAGKTITYFPNTFLITRSNDIKIVRNKRSYIRRPVLQIDMKEEVWLNLLERFDKRS
jgi:hypothetical protein